MVDSALDIDVPPASKAGIQIRLAESGHTRADRSRGDLVVVLGIDPAKQPPPPTNRKVLVIFLVVAILVLVAGVMMGR
jgi:hypothetical protein